MSEEEDGAGEGGATVGEYGLGVVVDEMLEAGTPAVDWTGLEGGKAAVPGAPTVDWTGLEGGEAAVPDALGAVAEGKAFSGDALESVIVESVKGDADSGVGVAVELPSEADGEGASEGLVAETPGLLTVGSDEAT